MNFVDYCQIKLCGGHGGSGIISFQHEKFRPLGGPNGGDGGDGGNIYLVVDQNLTSLADFRQKHVITSQNGKNGQRNNRHGANGIDIYLKVPKYTWVIEKANSKRVIKILTLDNEIFLVAKGGAGGRGNARFKSSRNQAPYCFDNGDEGGVADIILETKLLAHVGLVGYPNVGKSSLLNRLARTKSIVGNYAFTTLLPVPGRLTSNPSISIVDIPGIITGAAVGKGLGLAFLRHIEHCHVLLLILDGAFMDRIWHQFCELTTLLREYNPLLLEKKQFIIINKSDLLSQSDMLEVKKTFLGQKHKSILFISALMNKNIAAVEQLVNDSVDIDFDYSENWAEEMNTKFIDLPALDNIIIKMTPTCVLLEGEQLRKIVAKTPPVTEDNKIRLQQTFANLQIEKFLRKQQVSPNLVVRIYDFTYLRIKD